MDTSILLNYLDELKEKYTLKEESRQKELTLSKNSIKDTKKAKREEEQKLTELRQDLAEYNDYEKKKNRFILKLIFNLLLNVILLKVVNAFSISHISKLIVNLIIVLSSNGFIIGKFEKYYQGRPIKKIKKDYPTINSINEEIYQEEKILNKLDLQISSLESSLIIIEHLDTYEKALQMINDLERALIGQERIDIEEIDRDNEYLWLTNVSRKLRKGEKEKNG